MKNIIEKIVGVKKNIFLKNYTTYKIGGPAKYFFIAKTKEDLISILKISQELKIKTLVIGGGSNLLFSDKGFKGLVIKIDFSDINVKKDKILTGAGVTLTKLAYLSADKRLSGLEWSAGMPGTIGGAIYGNAQAFGTKISSLVENVEVLNMKNLTTSVFTNKQCKFSLKNSIFKGQIGHSKDLVIISATLNFKKDNIVKIKKRIKEFLEYRKSNHPMNFPSAGSVFVNPEINPHTRSSGGNFGVGVKIKKLYIKYPELEGYVNKGIIPAGYLIAKSGLSGKKIGKAQISEKHSNFIVNLGGAKAKDVLALIKIAQNKVKKNFGIKLEPEVQLVK